MSGDKSNDEGSNDDACTNKNDGTRASLILIVDDFNDILWLFFVASNGVLVGFVEVAR